MQADGTIFGRTILRRSLALVACAALLYFAFGSTLPHQHPQGPNGACHICQALHMQALAASRVDLTGTLEVVAWYSSMPRHAVPSDSFSFHRASRAPPTE